MKEKEGGAKGKYRFPYEIFQGYDLKRNIEKKKFEMDAEIPQHLLNNEKYLLFISGLAAIYWKEEDDKKIIADFKSVGQLLGPLIHINSPKMGTLHVQCLEDTEVIFINKTFLHRCALHNSSIADFYNRLLKEGLISIFFQFKLQKTVGLEKRYITFLEEYKHIYNRISDRMIASYLGIHYSSLSRLKSKLLISKKNGND